MAIDCEVTQPSEQIQENTGACSCGQRDLCSCLCGEISVSPSYSFESGITAEEYQEFLLYSFNNGPDAVCLPDNFDELISNYWEIYQNLACNSNDLRYLYTRSAVITALMGCAIFDVTRRTSISESNNKTESEQKSDAETQGQTTSSSSSYNDSIFESAYSDFANSLLRAESQRSAESTSRDTSQTVTDDVGHGASSSITEGERDSSSERVSRDESQSQGKSSMTGARRGSDYSFAHDATDSNAGHAVVGGMKRTGTRSANVRLMLTDSYNSSSATRSGTSSKNLTADSYSQSWSQRLSSSYFQAVLDSNTNSRSNAVAFDYSSAKSDAESHSAGKGQSAAETEARGQAGSQRTSESLAETTNKTDGIGNSYSITEYRANSQKFDHLAILLENTNEAIQEILTLRAAQIGFGITKLLFANPDGYCNIGAIRRHLCKPGGVYGIYCCPTPVKGGKYAN